jgi:hypothetical protein
MLLHNAIHTISESGMSIDLPVRNEVSIPFLDIGAEGSAPFSFSLLVLLFGAESIYRLSAR